MSSRVNLFTSLPAMAKNLSALSQALSNASLDKQLKYLTDVRASQLNHCAFCLDMHVKEAKLHGERELRLHHVAIWRESPLFSAREKAALALTEALTRPDAHGVSDALYSELQAHFSETEIAELMFSLATINAWNRLMVATKVTPGSLDSAYGLDRADLR